MKRMSASSGAMEPRVGLNFWHSWKGPHGYARDLRCQLLPTVMSGPSVCEIARSTGMYPGNLRRWKRKHAVGQSLELACSPGGSPQDHPSK